MNLYAIVRDEMFFLDAFLDHYRQLGVDQFLILDDSSSDGTREFLSAQADCLVLSSDLGFGDPVAASGEDGARTTRAGTLLKKIIPQKYLKNKYAVYADADEFLILPEGIDDIRTAIRILERDRIACVAASLIDFYPQGLVDLDRSIRARSFSELLERYPYYDATSLVELVADDWPKPLGEGASKRLFREHGIKDVPPTLSNLPSALARFLPFPTPRSAWLKTPLIKWNDDTWLDGSHNANVPPSHRVLLSMAHFKFTFDLKRRVEQALNTTVPFAGRPEIFPLSDASSQHAASWFELYSCGIGQIQLTRRARSAWFAEMGARLQVAWRVRMFTRPAATMGLPTPGRR